MRFAEDLYPGFSFSAVASHLGRLNGEHPVHYPAASFPSAGTNHVSLFGEFESSSFIKRFMLFFRSVYFITLLFWSPEADREERRFKSLVNWGH